MPPALTNSEALSLLRRQYDNDGNGNRSGLSSGLIILIVVVIILKILFWCTICYCRQKRRKRQVQEEVQRELRRIQATQNASGPTVPKDVINLNGTPNPVYGPAANQEERQDLTKPQSMWSRGLKGDAHSGLSKNTKEKKKKKKKHEEPPLPVGEVEEDGNSEEERRWVLESKNISDHTIHPIKGPAEADGREVTSY